MFARILLLFLPIVLLPACSGQVDDSDPPIRIWMPDEGAPLNQVFSFEIDPQGLELTGVDADMPAHGHGINTTPVFEKLENGRYRIDGMALHMPGAWEIYFDLKSADGSSFRMTYPLELSFQ
jgi:hypothetical protein